MTENKKKRGRPKTGKALENRVILRLSDLEKTAYEAKADQQNLSLSAWIRLVLNRAID
jgi:predicted HicB family RNase H-like nuclease